MTTKHERTIKMMENFVYLHNKGHSVCEIAKMYDLSESTVYRHLGEIALSVDMTRRELLKRHFTADHSGRNFTPVKPVDRSKLNGDFAALMTEIESLQAGISKTIEDLEIYNGILEEEIK